MKTLPLSTPGTPLDTKPSSIHTSIPPKQKTYFKTKIKRTAHFQETKELYHCDKLKYSNPYIVGTRLCKPLIFQTYIETYIEFSRNHSLKYRRSATLGCKDIGIRKLEFVAKTQFLCYKLLKRWISLISNLYFLKFLAKVLLKKKDVRVKLIILRICV